jgi:hypothetical protein
MELRSVAAEAGGCGLDGAVEAEAHAAVVDKLLASVAAAEL